ncbi:MAG TPA: hypothetical protein VLQ91_22550 [Draconibacterium sp.]|nr:hypothetical protein [Draconibacterium sp.]
MTVYLYNMHLDWHTKVKSIHRFASYLKSWFPKLGSYQAFNNRLNKHGGAFTRLVEIRLTDFQSEDCCLDQSLLDSMPIIAYSGKHSSKTAVSRVIQPVESIFNWLIDKTDIQRASKVSSSKGLMVYAFGRLAAAFIPLII